MEDIIKKILSMKRESKHCKGKKDNVRGYDHTGYINWECECGFDYGWEKISLTE